MRKTILFNIFLLVCMFVLVQVMPAQVQVQAGTAAYGAAGEYALPFVPLVSTPSISLESAPLQVGASNATGENVAGATNSTLSLAAGQGAYISEESGAPSETGNTRSNLDLGAAEFEGDQSVALLMVEEHLSKTTKGAAHLYTNQDVEQANNSANQTAHATSHQYTNQDAEQAREHTNQNAGTVNLNGKVERVPEVSQ